MISTLIAEAAAASDSSRPKRRGQGGISAAARVQKKSGSSTEATCPKEAQLGSGRVDCEGAGVKGPGSPLVLEGLRASAYPHPTVATEDAEPGGWSIVQRKRSRKDHLDQRSLIAWGLPTGTDPGRFAKMMPKGAKCW